MIGLFTFSWNKKVMNLLFWKIFLFVSVIWNLCYQYFLPLPKKVSEMGFGGLFRPIAATITFSLFVPLLIALYLYAFKRSELWKK